MTETSPLEPFRRPSRMGALARRARPLVPWASLLAGIAGAGLMERGPDRARLVAIATCASWVVLSILAVLQGLEPARLGPRSRRLWNLGRFGTVAVVQWSVQMALWFAVPFFVHAMVASVEHVAFVVVLVLAAIVSLWDPLTESLMGHPATVAILPGLATFAGLLAVLPGFGWSIETSLWVAAAVTTAGMPIAAAAGAPRGRRARFGAASLGVAALIPLAIATGGAFAIPAAPLRLMGAEIGTTMIGRDLQDPRAEIRARPWRLACATAIRAPLGLRDRLFHVWRHDGVRLDTIPLRISGGRRAGFRTWSVKHNFGSEPWGTWTCTVETAAGQRLGSARIDVRRPG